MHTLLFRYNTSEMVMVKVKSVEDLKSLPKTKWNISQPADNDIREDALTTGILFNNISFSNSALFSMCMLLYIYIGGLDLIIVPGLGFTVNGKRLGRGKGYYDQCIAEYKTKYSSNSLKTIGLSFSQQICSDIPTNQQDSLVDFVIHP